VPAEAIGLVVGAIELAKTTREGIEGAGERAGDRRHARPRLDRADGRAVRWEATGEPYQAVDDQT
jgi:hypothetical protein